MLVDDAIRYAEHGLAVFPLQPHGKQPTDGSRGFKDATTNVAQIRSWWSYAPDMNIGMATGAASGGVFVIDVDQHGEADGGLELSIWQAEHGKFPETASSVTGSGGTHYFFKAPAGVSVKSAAHVIPGVDVRGDGGYVVLPPSVHPNGNRYEWDMEPWEDCEIAEADATVLEFVRTDGAQERQRFELPDVIPQGKRDDTLFRYACSLQAQGLPDDKIMTIVSDANRARCNPPMSDEEVRNKVRSALGYDKGKSIESVGGVGKVRLMTNSSGKVLQTADNAIRAIEGDPALHGRFWYDRMAYTRMVTCPVPWDGQAMDRPLIDEDYTGLVAYLEHSYGLVSTQKIISAAQFVCRKHERNPVTEWLDTLEWDGKYRIGTMLPMLGVENDEYSQAVERLFMLGAVSRAYRPGCKFDYVPILVGPQGIGKSRYVALLAHKPMWYSDNFNTIEGDTAVEKIRGLWIAELAELLATKRAREVEAIKSFVTSTKDVIRPKYARETVQRARVCVFIGTTNDSDFLTDSTGNRRFLPVECRAERCNPWLFSQDADGYVEQMWAEAVHVFKTEHPSLVLPDHLMARALELQESHTEDRPVIALVHKIADELLATMGVDAYEDTQNERLCIRQVFEQLPEDIQRRDQRYVYKEIAQAMDTADGWVRMRKKAKTNNYGTQRCWIPERRGRHDR